MAKRPKKTFIQVRADPAMKALAVAAAAADGRSLTNYVIALIKADAAKRGIKVPK
jgi:predicted HicB family RNase H-like nuclease